jgi:ribosomal protein S18 acetylase RimI-like enzyme
VALFADYEPERRGTPLPVGLATRPATASDVPALAALRAARDGIPEASAAANFERLLARAESGDAVVRGAWVAEALAGYGTVERLAWEGLPAGWYLGGVVVAPALRRRGIGARLTQERMEWVAERGREAFYFVNARNRASIDLHAPFGFREVARDIRVPGLTFTGGIGLLFRAELPRGSA